MGVKPRAQAFVEREDPHPVLAFRANRPPLFKGRFEARRRANANR
jgi:hypothetical protein